MFTYANIDTIQSNGTIRVKITTTAEHYKVDYQDANGWWHIINATPFLEQAIMEANLWLDMKWGK